MIGAAREARSLAAGRSLGQVRHEALTRMEIAWYMVASYDRNPPIRANQEFETLFER